MGLFGTRCSCGRWLAGDRCVHCDHAQLDPHDKACVDCKDQAISWGKAGKEIDAQPFPDAHVIHDMGPTATPASAPPGLAPIGAVGRCTGCGGRTYVTDTGPWCPRAGCHAQEEA